MDGRRSWSCAQTLTLSSGSSRRRWRSFTPCATSCLGKVPLLLDAGCSTPTSSKAVFGTIELPIRALSAISPLEPVGLSLSATQQEKCTSRKLTADRRFALAFAFVGG